MRVYPRGCGGTERHHHEWRTVPGLSPRVRGNPPAVVCRLLHLRSIPAGAGEPPVGDCRASVCRVYPRGCGGTDVATLPWGTEEGLSPRVRGNHDQVPDAPVDRGSIPAGAGEPHETMREQVPLGVYPRGCGGTHPARISSMLACGLSPRVRGNLTTVAPPAAEVGSIPAGAGEPASHLTSMSVREVYPRGCGGTRCSESPHACKQGLSPRVRGNHEQLPPRLLGLGSIPAGAGEPDCL